MQACGPNQHRLEGTWVISSYKDHGKDQLPLINDLKVDNLFSFYFPDPEDNNGSWGASNFRHDTIYGIGAILKYDRPVLKFSSTQYFIALNQQYLANTNTDSSFKSTIPLYLFEGDWRVNKKGSCTMELTRVNDQKVIMVLDKSSLSCNR